MAGYYVCPSICTSFLDNSSYSIHQVVLKLGGQLNYEVVQCIILLFRGYSAPNFDRDITRFKQFFRLDFFLDNSSYSFHLIGLKHGGQIDHEVMQNILFQDHTTPNLDSMIDL